MSRRGALLRAGVLLGAVVALASLAPIHAGAQGSTQLTIYSSLPLHGDSRPQSADVVRGEKLALSEAGGQAGGFTIRYVSLDDSIAQVGKWEPGQTSENARIAAEDASTIAYLGEFNSGATAISLPILNIAGIAQVSPSNTYVGLTRQRGGDRGEPDKYYPGGTRTYARVAPADHIQAAAVVRYMRLARVRRVYLFHDKEIYGKGLARLVRTAARRAKIRVVGFRAVDDGFVSRGVLRSIRRGRADAMFFGGITQLGAPRLFNRLHKSRPRMKLFGADGVAESAFTRRLTRGARKWTYITNPTLHPSAYNARGRAFVRRFRARYRHHPEPYAIYGYEAMSLVLDAMNRAAPRANDRQAVVDAIFRTRNRASVLGRYSIDSNGDTTLPRYGGLRVSRGGLLLYDRTLHARL